jgi:predicted kinase
LDHVYLFPDRLPPEDLAVIDCIEFNERFRFADPVADIAFLAMDLKFEGEPELAREFADAWFAVIGDAEGRDLLPFYTAYRAVVRGKVEGFELRETEVPATEKAAALARARAHWLLALGELEPLGDRPALVLMGGVPGSGKSSLARELAGAANFTVVRSDLVRKELAGVAPEARPGRDFATDIYSPEWTERTYAACRQRAEALLWEGRRVIVDATFREEERRRNFIDAARRLAVPVHWFECHADGETIRQRLAARRNDASDADWAVYEQSVATWEAPSARSTAVRRAIGTSGAMEDSLRQALDRLREANLVQ